MLRRLILCDGVVSRTVADHVTEAAGRTYAVTDDTGWLTTLEERSVRAVEGNPVDGDLYPSAIDLVVIGGDNVETNLAAARAVRDRFPGATVIAAVDATAAESQRRELERLTDELVDTTAAVADRTTEAVLHSGGAIVVELVGRLRSLEGRLGIFAHDNPDPDAIASGAALASIAETVGTDAEVCYFGEITHQENRAFVNALELDLRNLEPDAFDPDAYDAIALVDHARPGVNDSLPSDTDVEFVVDHHPLREPIDRTDRFVDVRPEIGSTSTILAAYYDRLGLDPGTRMATALVYGIRTDTDDFVRGITREDFEAAAQLLPAVDRGVLDRIESPSVSPDVFRTLAAAIRNRRVEDGTVVSYVGELTHRDALAQAADRLLGMEEVETTVVYGYQAGTVYVSGRARGSEIDLGAVLRDAYDAIGSAGGHPDMAGAQIPLGILGAIDPEETDADFDEVLRAVVEDRLFEAIETPRGSRSSTGWAGEGE